MDLRKELRPLYVSMALAGFYHESENPEENDSGSEEPPSSKKIGSSLYCYIVVGLMWVNFLRYIPSFWVGPDAEKPLLVDRVIHVIFFLQCATSGTIFLFTANARKGFKSL
ncbi:hypothetical protein BaRGS_00031734 [Batillaria attramentaria]|uniref:Uncharacterized protein n=1 Tax=Batillaria attramentaria TaxID=370345 RepID=A0ABD0JQL3_9CAEN